MSGKEIMAQFEFDMLKGRAMYYSKLSLERPLTDDEFAKYKAICKQLGANV